MRVLIISDRYYPDNSGTSVRSIAFAEGLAGQGVDVHIATLARLMVVGTSEEAIHTSSEVIRVVKVHRYASQLKMFFKLLRLCQQQQFDLIHARGPRYGFIAYLLSMVLGIPFITELNYILPQKNLVKKFLLTRALRASDRLIVLSKFACDWITEELGIPIERVDVIINRIDTSQFNLIPGDEKRKDLGIEKKTVIGYVGTFHEWQGVLDFVRITHKIRDKRADVVFLMVGYGPDHQATLDLAEELGLSQDFIFTGNVPREEVPAYISAMDIVLLARTPDLLNQIAIPLKLFEFMAMEKVVVVTPVKSLVEVIKDGQNGVIAGPELEDVAGKILGLIDDKKMRKSIGRIARTEVMANNDWDSAIDELIQCYQLVFNKNK